MSLGSKFTLLAVAGALLLAAMAPASAGASAVYKLNSEEFRIALVVDGKRLVRLRIWAQERCSDGTTPARTFDELDLHRVAAKGRLLYVDGYSTEYGYGETRLSIHVAPGAIKGAFFDIDSEGYVCATGHSGNRTRNFTARRSDGSNRGRYRISPSRFSIAAEISSRTAPSASRSTSDSRKPSMISVLAAAGSSPREVR
jgi:hypothetical protein